jgi:hypothetical protein
VKGSNWFERPADSDLKTDIDLLKDYHSKLVEAVSVFQGSKLTKIPKGSKTTYLDLAIGVAAHDLYHAGQIQLLKRLQQTK